MVMNWDLLKQHYLKANQATQLDVLLLNLIRIQTLAQNNLEGIIAHHLIRESQFLIEWTVPTMNLETDIDFAVELVDLQRLLGHWKLDWPEHWDSDQTRLAIIEDLQPWCDRLQQHRALLTPQSS
jgi:hypothetical protein